MANELVKVELITNPEVTRTMTAASFRQNQNRWQLAGTVKEPAEVVKKKDAEVVAPVEALPENEPVALLNGLRMQYEAQFGEKPDLRWNIKSLSLKINSKP